jgi:hypothetical protein
VHPKNASKQGKISARVVNETQTRNQLSHRNRTRAFLRKNVKENPTFQFLHFFHKFPRRALIYSRPCFSRLTAGFWRLLWMFLDSGFMGTFEGCCCLFSAGSFGF